MFTENKQNKYAFRKYKGIGLVSVVIGMIVFTNHTVYAETNQGTNVVSTSNQSTPISTISLTSEMLPSFTEGNLIPQGNITVN